jgi:hypothetical protein
MAESVGDSRPRARRRIERAVDMLIAGVPRQTVLWYLHRSTLLEWAESIDTHEPG